MASYVMGNSIRISGQLNSSSGTPVAPGSARLILQSPAGAQSVVDGTSGLVNPSTGSFYFDWLPPSPGFWLYRFESTGAWVAALEGSLTILSGSF